MSANDSPTAEDLIWQRTQEASAKILYVKDRLNLDPAQDRWLRKVVLDELNDLGDLCVALLNTAGPSSAMMMGLLREIHEAAVAKEST